MTVHRPRTDAALAAEIRDDPDHTFGLLFEHYSPLIYNYAFRQTASWDLAEEITSTVFLEAWRSRHRLRVENDSVLPWLYGIATNVCRRQRRTLFRRGHAIRRLPPVLDEPDHADDVAGRLDDERRMADVLAVIDRLPTVERDVVVLVVWEELDYRSAAVALGVPIGTVRSRLNRARRRLSTSLAAPHVQEQQ
ncbi:RNA polymerase sigma factor [Flindersiella endophytica]